MRLRRLQGRNSNFDTLPKRFPVAVSGQMLSMIVSRLFWQIVVDEGNCKDFLGSLDFVPLTARTVSNCIVPECFDHRKKSPRPDSPFVKQPHFTMLPSFFPLVFFPRRRHKIAYYELRHAETFSARFLQKILPQEFVSAASRSAAAAI